MTSDELTTVLVALAARADLERAAGHADLADALLWVRQHHVYAGTTSSQLRADADRLHRGGAISSHGVDARRIAAELVAQTEAPRA